MAATSFDDRAKKAIEEARDTAITLYKAQNGLKQGDDVMGNVGRRAGMYKLMIVEAAREGSAIRRIFKNNDIPLDRDTYGVSQPI